MKLSEIENVKKAHNILISLEKNITKLENYFEEDEKPDSGGIKGVFSYGYWCYVSENSDGSGFCVDLTGCYVANEVYEATLNVLVKQREKVIDYLKSLYVEVDEI